MTESTTAIIFSMCHRWDAGNLCQLMPTAVFNSRKPQQHFLYSLTFFSLYSIRASNGIVVWPNVPLSETNLGSLISVFNVFCPFNKTGLCTRFPLKVSHMHAIYLVHNLALMIQTGKNNWTLKPHIGQTSLLPVAKSLSQDLEYHLWCIPEH